MTYSYGPGTYATAQLHAEIAAVLPTLAGINGGGYTTIGGPATTVQVVFPAALTAPQKATLDAKVSAHVPAAPTTADKADGVTLPARVLAALCLRDATNFATLPAAVKTAVQKIIDDAAALVLSKVQ